MIYLLSITEQGNADGRFSTYDTARAFVVRANSEIEARTFAMLSSGDEVDWRYLDEEDAPEQPLFVHAARGAYTMDPTWMRPDLVRCEDIGGEGEPGIVLREFQAG